MGDDLNIRLIAFNCLKRVETEKAYSNIVISNAIIKNSLSNTDKGFLSNLVYGVIDKRITLDYYINKFSSVPTRKLDVNVLIILRMSVYQIKYMDTVPDSAICNEAVKLGKKICSRYASFINAVLRAVAKSELISAPISYNKKDFHSYTRFLSVKHSFPEWLIDKWIEDFGRNKCEEILESFTSVDDSMSIRVNTLKCTRNEIKEALENSFDVEDSSLYENGLIINNPQGIFDSKAYSEGWFYVQDQGSMLIPAIAKEKISHSKRVLDLCAAPGGKTTQIAEFMNNEGEVIACDLHENKLHLIKENASRLGAANIRTVQNDATILNDDFIGGFDVVLVDAPCSGTGVLANKPDIKWNRKPSDIEDLSKIQQKILSYAFEYLKNDGILIYSTCSLDKQENENVINDFLNSNEYARAVGFSYGEINAEDGFFTLLPSEYHTDGFFMSVIEKI